MNERTTGYWSGVIYGITGAGRYCLLFRKSTIGFFPDYKSASTWSCCSWSVQGVYCCCEWEYAMRMRGDCFISDNSRNMSVIQPNVRVSPWENVPEWTPLEPLITRAPACRAFSPSGEQSILNWRCGVIMHVRCLIPTQSDYPAQDDRRRTHFAPDRMTCTTPARMRARPPKKSSSGFSAGAPSTTTSAALGMAAAASSLSSTLRR